MKIGITGSRSLDSDAVKSFMKGIFDSNWKKITLMISGGCKDGPDRIAYDYAIDTGIEFYTYTPRKYPSYPIRTYDKGCNFKRNSKIVENCDILLAFYDGKSGGTKDTIEKGIKSGKKVVVYILDPATGDLLDTKKFN